MWPGGKSALLAAYLREAALVLPRLPTRVSITVHPRRSALSTRSRDFDDNRHYREHSDWCPWEHG
jgi:hypothetical protein